MRRAFVALFLSFLCSVTAVHAQEKLSRADLDFFFERIHLEDEHWQFRFSRNVQDQHFLYRIRSGKLDVTGVCKSGHILTLVKSASLEIKRSDLDLFFEPINDNGLSFHVRMILQPQCSYQGGPLTLEATKLFPHNQGNGLAFAKE